MYHMYVHVNTMYKLLGTRSASLWFICVCVCVCVCVCLSTQAAGYAFDESMGRVLPEDPTQLRELKEKGQLNELPPSQVRVCVYVWHA